MKPKNLLGLFASATLCLTANAATFLWDGGDTTADNQSGNSTTTGQSWLAGGNWDDGAASAPLAAWSAGDSAVFGGSAASQTVTAGTLTLGNLTFGSGGDGSGTTGTNYTITGGTITLSTGSVFTANTNATLSSTLTGAGSLVKQGGGSLTLSGTKSYTGGTTVNAGTLVVGTGGSTGVIRGALAIGNGAIVSANTNWSFGYASGNCVSGISITGGTLNFSGAADGGGTSSPSITMTGGTISGSRFDWYNGITNAPELITLASPTTATVSSGFRMRLATTNQVKLTVAQGTTPTGIDLLLGGAITTNATNGLNKSGPGTAVLSAANSYGGTTTVTGGKLILGGSGTLAASDITVKNTASFQVAATGKTLKSLAVEDGSALILAAAPAATTTVTNALTFTSNPSFTVAPILAAAPITGATMDLLSAASIVGTAGTITTDLSGNGATRVAGSTAVSGNKLVLTITSGAALLTWENTAATGLWNFNDDANFTGATPGTFLTYDGVTFGNTAAGTVTLEGNLAPGSVAVDASADYTFTGNGSITGGATVTKSNSGKLTVNTANSHSGGTVLNAGILDLGHAAALGTGTLTLAGGTLDSSVAALVNSNNNAQAWNGDFTFAGSNDLNLGTGAVNLAATRQVTINAGTLAVGGSIAGSGFGLIKAGAGTLALTGSNPYTGITTVNAGTLLLSGNANSLTNAGYNIGTGGTVEIHTGAATWTARNGLTFAGSAGTLVKSGTGNLDLGGSDYGSVIDMASGAVIDIREGSIRLQWGYNKTGWANNKADMNIAAGASFDLWDYGNSGANYARIDALTGAGTIQRGISGTTTGGLEIGVDNGSGIFDGTIQNGVGTSKINLLKSGTGTQTLTGFCTHTGTTTINAGTLVIDGSVSNSDLTVGTGGTLAGIGTVKTATVSGTLSPGNSIGTLIVNGSLTLAADSKTVIQIDKTGGTTIQDTLNAGSVTYGGTLEVTATGEALAAGDEFRVFEAGTYVSSTFAATLLPELGNPTLSWDLSRLTTDGTIAVVAYAPTPVFNPGSGGYLGAQTITMTSGAGTTIHYTYTTDGTEPPNPTTTSTQGAAGSGTATFSLPTDTMLWIKAIAAKSGSANSPVNTATYGTVTTPAWIEPLGGTWSEIFNWEKSYVPGGANVTADFSKLTLADTTYVSLDSARTLGSLVFGDQGNTYDWVLSGSNTLTLASAVPTIKINNRTTTIAAPVAGADGLIKSGEGTLALTGVCSFTGPTTIAQGTLSFLVSASDRFSNSAGNITIDSGAIFQLHSTSDARFCRANNYILGGGTFLKTGATPTYLAYGASLHQQFDLSPGGLIRIAEGVLSDFQTASTNRADLAIDTGATARQITADSYFDALNGGGTLLNANNKNLFFGVDNGSGTFAGTIGSGSGAITKEGTGTQTLAGPNTYSGVTIVNDGTLQLAATGSLRLKPITHGVVNGISGAGTLILDGILDLDLSTTDATHGNSWLLVNTDTLTESYGPNFGLSGFSKTGTGIWTRTIDTNKWTFTESSGLLTVGAVGGYQDWMDSFTTLIGDDKLPPADPDHDGLSNLVEFVTNGDPTSGSRHAGLPTVAAAGDDLVITYSRRDDSEYLNPMIEFSTSLAAASWTVATDENSTITVQENGADPDTVSVTIPKADSQRIFARIAVTMP